jgi:hypothetical protein
MRGRRTEDERRELGRAVKLANRYGDYSLSEIGRVAIIRLLRQSRNSGYRWLAEQIDESKEVAQSDSKSKSGPIVDLASINHTTGEIAS